MGPATTIGSQTSDAETSSLASSTQEGVNTVATTEPTEISDATFTTQTTNLESTTSQLTTLNTDSVDTTEAELTSENTPLTTVTESVINTESTDVITTPSNEISSSDTTVEYVGTSTQNVYTTMNDLEDTESTTVNGNTSTESTTESIDTTTAAICPPGVFGSIPHPERCDAFFMCMGGSPILLTCGEGFEYDDTVKVLTFK